MQVYAHDGERSSTLFTVSREGYFDSVGSTIEFETLELDGDLHLKQVAHSKEVWSPVGTGVLAGEAENIWNEQADNLRRNLP